jgi:hypothetical protein
MTDTASLLGVLGLPLLGAILFACAAMLLKRTSRWNIDVWRTSFVCNLATGLAFQPFHFFGPSDLSWLNWWQPVVVASLYVIGQAFTLTSLAQGEISVAAPVLGLKIVFVPIFLWLLGNGLLPASTWIACSGATLAVVLLNTSDGHAARGKTLFSIVTATVGAAAFALFDVCVQIWSVEWTHGSFLPTMFLISSLMSFGLVPLFAERLVMLPRAAWPFLLGGAVFFAGQAVCIVCSVAFWQQVAVSNVVYSTRGLWSLLFLWFLGRHLNVADLGLTPRVFALRVLGALLLLGSIIILVM